jgi:hypothetical protein
MQYMFLIYYVEDALSEQELTQCYAESVEYAKELHACGKQVVAAPLHPTLTSTSVRNREGKRVVTDGPFAETREQLGGLFMVDAENLDEAIKIAEKIPAGHWGTIEIRPVLELPALAQI